MSRWTLWLILCFLLAAPPALAKEELDPKIRERAAQLFEDAEALYKVKEYEKALVGFKEAYLLTSEPTLLFNIGQCHRQLGQLEEAKKSYEIFLRDDPKSPLVANAEARIKEIEEEIARRASKGSIEVSSKQDPVEVYLDGEARGVTPLRLEVEPGDHRLELRKDGYLPSRVALTIEAAQAFSIKMPLEVNNARGRYWLLGGVGMGSLGALAGGISAGLSLQARRLQSDLLEEGNAKIPLLMGNAVVFAVVSEALLGGAVVTGGIGYWLRRGVKKEGASAP